MVVDRDERRRRERAMIGEPWNDEMLGGSCSSRIACDMTRNGA